MSNRRKSIYWLSFDQNQSFRTCCHPARRLNIEFSYWNKRSGREPEFHRLEECVVRLRLRDNESVNDAVRRFRKLVEHSGVKKELRKREFYEKPSEERRREKRRAKNRARMNQMMNG